MVTAVTNFGRSGLYDWLVQRVSGVVLLAYFIFIGAVVVANPDMSYQEWRTTFEPTWVRVFSVAALLSLAAHAWIGLWCTLTDYVTPRMMGAKANLLRGVLTCVCAVALFTYVVWGISIIWGS
ncbi:succinate dehydrogenase, hydrophobic membrane anchor protein [Halieaceae bacterium IMCC14734]|uniref:Succinate dehydrogenase hydrophobic membrane anchor subunit n=1 Tax=Candidatus Litorirhabdus singularis TaxID=2518993 RepID=A0ABT3TIA2_9GAMM|nr:succinate dehydrogenase, hydrophobic membrane anchor protein [Candidatus Litorirhabdus singularis]MCX2981481.1 succinate dehydrogenase, hydrophobic membrane anchor protein [Candidatus Litorirhabdus singularis]